MKICQVPSFEPAETNRSNNQTNNTQSIFNLVFKSFGSYNYLFNGLEKSPPYSTFSSQAPIEDILEQKNYPFGTFAV